MQCPRLLSVVLALTLAASCAAEPAGRAADDQEAAPATLFDPALHMRTSDVRPGMTGYGLSVFKGTQIDRFEVEVMAVLRRSEQIATDVILIRASGANLEHTGPIAGMSGSPIYLVGDDGKERLVGAFAFGWPGVKEPIAGVQPIEAMLQVPSAPRRLAAAQRPDAGRSRTGEGVGSWELEVGRPDRAPSASASQLPTSNSQLPTPVVWNLASAGAIPGLHLERPVSLAELLQRLSPERARPALPGGLRPLSLPLGMSGFTTPAARELTAALAAGGLGPVHPVDLAQEAAGPAAGPSDAERLEPGSTLAVPILLGDLNIVATGTCTTVIGDRVFGFGHPLVGEGESGLPMAAGEIAAVIPTQDISFKLGTPGKVVGTLASDATPGIAGTLGPVPEMIPVTLRIRRGEQEQTFRFQAARHRMLTIAALAMASQSAIGLLGEADPDGATRWDVTMRFTGGRTLRLRDIQANATGFGFGDFGMFGGGGLLGALVTPLMAIQENPFERVELESLEADVDLITGDQVQRATLEDITLPRQNYKPGETVRINLGFRLYRGSRVQRTVELTIPNDLPPGQYPLTVSDAMGALMTATSTRPFEFEARSIDDVFQVLNSLERYDSTAVYVSLARPEMRVAVGREAMPELPASRALLLAESGRSEVVPYAPAVATKLEVPFVVTEGEAEAVITVTRE